MKVLIKPTWLKSAGLLASTCFATAAFAAGPPQPSVLSNTLALTLLFIIVALLLAIALLANVVMGAAQLSIERYKEKREKESNTPKVVTTLLLTVVCAAAIAQDAPAAVAANPATYGGLSASTFYVLMATIALELIVLVVLLIQLRSLLAKEMPVAVASVAKAKSFKWKLWWEKMNSFKPVHEEEKIDMGHEYDGIRELDNKLPKWWLYGFYGCVIFAAVYLYRYHVAHTAPSSEQEFAIAMAKAETEKEEYLKKAGNRIDENSVTLITDAGALSEGKKLFDKNCTACHGAEGGGNTVGPNLTDEYWLHKGSVKDVFKTIKYGVPEKSMRSWKDDFSPAQIAQLASYIKSLKGTKPANAKEPQGELYTEDVQPAADSTKAADGKLALK